MERAPFRRYSRYLKERYGEPVYRIAVDAGFTCPHRNSDGSGGCSFCDAAGSRAAYQEASLAGRTLRLRRGGVPGPGRYEAIRSQIARGEAFLSRRYGARRFILYFQAFSNTYAPVHVLRELYGFALSLAPFQELIVSTRPDCLGTEHADLLASYLDEGLDVWAELGLQSFHDSTLQRIRRGHGSAHFTRAFRLLRERGVKISAHLIFGLPGEGREEIMATVDRLAALRPDGVKIHNLNVAAGTALAKEYLRGELAVPSDRRHLRYVAEALERLPDETVIQRVTCDTRRDELIAPLSFMDKNRFYGELERYMHSRGLRQGRLCRTASAAPPPADKGSH